MNVPQAFVMMFELLSMLPSHSASVTSSFAPPSLSLELELAEPDFSLLELHATSPAAPIAHTAKHALKGKFAIVILLAVVLHADHFGS
jgi:hypothetical protein